MSSTQSSGALVSTQGRTLPLTHAHADIEAIDGIARMVLRQRFENPHDLPLEIVYSLPLPQEAAVSGFAFQLGERRITGEIDRKARARERYEEALAFGHTAALVEQERDTLFTQKLGNVPPRTAIEAEIVLDLALRYLEEGSYELRIPTTVAPRYLGEPGRVADAAVIAQDVSRERMPVCFTIEAHVRGASSSQLESTTHAVRSEVVAGNLVARFSEERGVPLDRDIVLRWRVAREEVGANVRVGRPRGSDSAFALFTLTPPLAAAVREGDALPRDLVLLLDTSGSMGGLPMEQLKRVSLALVNSMSNVDTLEMISFSSSATRWKRGTTNMDESGRKAASKWIGSLYASGGTEMREAILAALAPLRAGAQRQVVLVTDGQIGFESEIVAAILDRLPAGSRVHTVGVGSGINRTLTAGAARAGRGIEVLADVEEDAERVLQRIVARTKAPIVTELTFDGDVVRALAPERLPDLFAGSPAIVAAEVDPKGGTVVVTGRTQRGAWRTEIVVPACDEASGAAAIEQLFARERVSDLEMRAAAGEHMDGRIEEVGLRHHIATRMTSWVAVTKETTVDPKTPFKSERMPHEIPYGTSAEQFGLRTMAPSFALADEEDDGIRSLARNMPMAAAPGAPPAASYGAIGGGASGGGGGRGGASDGSDRPTGAPPPPAFMPPPPAQVPPPAARPAPAAPKMKKGTLFSTIFGGRKKEEAPAEPMPDMSDLAESAKEGAARVVRLEAKITVRRDGRILVTVRTGGQDIEWALPMVATIETKNGKRIDARIVSTPPTGTHAAGTEFRLALEIAHDDGDDITRIVLDNDIVLVVG